MGVSLDLPLGVEELWSRKVILISIDEEARFHAPDRHRYRERCISFDCAKVLGELEFGRGHVVGRGDDTNRSGVTGPRADLLAVGNREVGDSQAEIDKVVGGRERGDLTRSGHVLTIVGKTRCNDLRIES